MSSSEDSMEIALGLATIEAVDEVTRLHFQQGQVLIYTNHRPPGTFVFLTGTVRLEEYQGRATLRALARLKATPESPFVIPPVDEVDQPVGVTVFLESNAEVLFVPRTVVRSQPAIAGAIREHHITTCSLKTIEPGTEPA